MTWSFTHHRSGSDARKISASHSEVVDTYAISEVLDRCKSKGLQNILALRGDPPTGAKEWTATDAQFKTATDLVRFIRKEYTGL